ncbi:FAD-binding oxidoreductase [Lentzea sp. NPDC005914]|uniref:FAD-binding oxidoreductase n=1 Tax=Lentzea sp. NPDC005914 TaxID=3154572 RepID=UPI0033D71A17
MLTRLSGWGRTAPTAARVVSTRDFEVIANIVKDFGARGVIARGLGRSYGDPAQNAGGVVLDMTRFDRVRRVAVEDCLVDVEAGVSLDALMRVLLPFGLWLPVLPGTRQVTVGGAIAADVHGKGHHVVGSFGNHVRSLDLLAADGSVRSLTPDGEDAALFWATVGGMGLTGVILRATLRVVPVETSYFVVDTERVDSLDELLERQSSDDDRYAESVAWFDAVTTGPRLGRGVLTRAHHARLDDLPARLRRDPLAFDAPRLLTVPDVLPSGLLNQVTGRAFSELWFRKSPSRTGEVQNITRFLHPLDVIGEWNRGYGPRGFLQYQFVVPFAATDVIRQVVARIAASGHVSALNVLKRFGPGNRAPLSFPMPGWTLCVDLPVRPGLGELCDELDELVLGSGGRHYLAKESRATAESVRRGYPRFEEWRAVRASVDPDGVFASDMSRRLNL